MSAESNQERKDLAEDLDLTDDDAGQVKGGVNPIEGGGDAGSSGFSLSNSKWTLRRRNKKKSSSSSSGPTPGGHPV